MNPPQVLKTVPKIIRNTSSHFYTLGSCTVQPKRWARYGLADIFGGPKVLDSKIIVYLRNFGEKIIALAKFML